MHLQDHPIMSERQPIIQFRDVRFAYPGGGDEALRGITLDVAAGEYVCVLGGNGSGKSTLAQLINALLVPTSGSVRVLGIDAATEPERTYELRQQVAMVFQHPDDQMVTSIVADDVAFGPENLGIPQPHIAERVREALAAVDMLDYAQADPAELSGGQCQRVAIAGALAMRPRVLVLDEPAAMLDAGGRLAIQDIIRNLRDQGIAIVHITHFMDDALDADRVIVMERGHIELEGAPAEVFAQHETLRRLGLELPFTMQLAERLAPAIPHLPAAANVEELACAISCAARGTVGSSFTHSAPHVNPDSPERPAAPVGTTSPVGTASPVGTTSPVGTASPGDPTRAQAAAIEFDHVSFSYADERHPHQRSGLLDRLGIRLRARMPRAADTLRDLSFTVPAGSLTALIGRTGSGKSTSAELACALKLPNTGAVRVRGIDTSDLARRTEVRASIGFVAQLPERQLFAETVFDDVAFGPRNLGLTEDEVTARVRGSLEAVDLSPTDELLERSPFAFSGGQQRCVALAGVLALQTPIIVLDEPMAGLDPRAREHMRRLLARLKRQGTTLLVISHDMNDVAALADHVVTLDSGSLVAEGTPAEVFTGNRDLLPGVPDAILLADELAGHGVSLHRAPLTLEDLEDEMLAGCYTVEPTAAPGAKASPHTPATEHRATPMPPLPAHRAEPAREPSPIHALDPRLKLAVTVIYMVSCLMVATAPQLILAGCFAIIAIALSRTSPSKLLRQLRPVVLFLVVTSLFNLFFVHTGGVLLVAGPVTIHAGGLSAAVLYTLRFLFLLLMGSLLMITTPPVALTDAAERLLAPLERIGVPISQGMLVLSIALHFVPTLSRDARAVANAQIARGAQLEGGGFRDRIRAFIPLAVPLFSAAVRHADNLARAMDARCYTGGSGRTHYHELRFRAQRDGIAALALLGYLALLIALR